MLSCLLILLCLNGHVCTTCPSLREAYTWLVPPASSVTDNVVNTTGAAAAATWAAGTVGPAAPSAVAAVTAAGRAAAAPPLPPDVANCVSLQSYMQVGGWHLAEVSCRTEVLGGGHRMPCTLPQTHPTRCLPCHLPMCRSSWALPCPFGWPGARNAPGAAPACARGAAGWMPWPAPVLRSRWPWWLQRRFTALPSWSTCTRDWCTRTFEPNAA